MSLRIHPGIGWLLLAVFCLAGCKTNDEAHSGRMASVVVSGHTREQIQQALAAVFLANGFVKMGDLTFEKPGSAWETANYGGWSSSRVWIRMRTEIVPMATGQFELGCDAFVVEGHGVPGVEVERKFWVAKRTECKKILDAVKAALAAPPETDGSVHPSAT